MAPRATALALFTLAIASSLMALEPRRPFPQHMLYAAGTIRPSHRTQAQQDDDVRAYYDVWKKRFLIAAGTLGDGRNLYRVSFGSASPARTVSEGQGFGMVIVAVMAGYDPDARTLFDGLWLFSRQHPSIIDPRLMTWEVPVERDDCNCSAFDGDIDIAFGLLLAEAQWGNDGPIRYGDEARTVITAIMQSAIGPASHLPMLSDSVPTDGPPYSEFTPRSSDFMPGHFRAFARITGDANWFDVIRATQAVITSLQTNFSPVTGLLPDFIVPASASDTTPRPAPPNFLESRFDGDYYYNAGRDPMRIGTDAVISGDPLSLVEMRKVTTWARAAAGGQPSRIRAGYQLDGTPLPGSDYFTIFFAAPLGVAAMTDASQPQWLNDIYDAVYAQHEDYYEDSVTLLSLLTMTGNMWSPDAQPPRLPKRRAVRR